MTAFRYTLLLVALLLSQNAISQCYPDRHSTTKRDYWESCSVRLSPNTDRGYTHWIRYELDHIRYLGQMDFWNYNDPAHLDRGIKEAFVDYSTNGIIWKSLGRFEFEQATGSSTYQGHPGPDFEGEAVKYILITAIESWGDENCVGFAEMRVNINDSTLPAFVSGLSGSCSETNANITWRADQFVNEDRWIVEQSTDGIHWDNQVEIPIVDQDQGILFDTDIAARAGDENIFRLSSMSIDGVVSNHGTVALSCAVNDIRAFPNPFGSYFELAFANDTIGTLDLEVFDASGKMVLKTKVNSQDGNQQIEATNLSSGTYWVKLSNELQEREFKLVKQQ